MATGSLIDIPGESLGRRERIQALDRRRVRMLEAVLAESIRTGGPLPTRTEKTVDIGVSARRRPRPGEGSATRGLSRR